jgi:hypothetical protein
MAKLGTLSFQANDNTDLFLKVDLFPDGVIQSDESLIGTNDVNFDSDKPWVTGQMSRQIPVTVDGDSSIIKVWFKGEVFPGPFTINIYIEYEEAEEVGEEEIEETEDEGMEEIL